MYMMPKNRNQSKITGNFKKRKTNQKKGKKEN